MIVEGKRIKVFNAKAAKVFAEERRENDSCILPLRPSAQTSVSSAFNFCCVCLECGANFKNHFSTQQCVGAKLRRLLKIRRLKRFVKIVGVLLIAWIIYRPITHFLCLPSAVRASWVEPLATTGTSYRYSRELFTGGEDARKVYSEFAPVFAASEQKRKLFATFKLGVGSAGLLRRYSTVEGRPILAWVLVQDGRITYVKDCSRDGGAPPWAVYKRLPIDFKLGFMHENEFVEGEPSSTNSPVVVFQIRVHNVLDSRQIDNEYFF